MATTQLASVFPRGHVIPNATATRREQQRNHRLRRHSASVVVRASEGSQGGGEGEGASQEDSRSSPVAESAALAPILVFGANGKTGKRCVQYAAKSGRPVVACTRKGSFSTSDLSLTTEVGTTPTRALQLV